MQLYSETGNYKLYQGSMLDMLEVIAPNSIDSIVTDPPYGLTSITKRFGGENSAANQYGRDGSFARLTRGFMGKEWDGSGIEYNPDTWRKCYTVLKSGGYLLAFGGTRTFHRIACAIEDAGFEIRDTIMWLYGSGFPKSMNIGMLIDKKNGVESPVVRRVDYPDIRNNNYENNDGTRIMHPIRQAQNEWNGWGTALKPAYEPVIVARKPCEGSCVDNVIQYGTGGMNIDGCRISTDDNLNGGAYSNNTEYMQHKVYGVYKKLCPNDYKQPDGRYPANVILTYDDTDFDEVCGGMPETKSPDDKIRKTASVNHIYGKGITTLSGQNRGDFGDEGSAARYFYCAKASKRDRDEGLELFDTKQCTGGGGGIGDYLNDVNSCSGKFGSEKAPHKNTHPTVKPVDLMQYLVRLVTPPNGTVLDPFNGSGSTGKAVMYENKDRNSGYKYIGIELTAEYLPIADARIRYAAGDHTPIEPAEQPLTGQISFFDLLGGTE